MCGCERQHAMRMLGMTDSALELSRVTGFGASARDCLVRPSRSRKQSPHIAIFAPKSTISQLVMQISATEGANNANHIPSHIVHVNQASGE